MLEIYIIFIFYFVKIFCKGYIVNGYVFWVFFDCNFCDGLFMFVYSVKKEKVRDFKGVIIKIECGYKESNKWGWKNL